MIDERYKDIGKRIYEARKTAGWSQEKLADKLGYSSAGTLSYYEAGLRRISLFDIYKVAELFQIPVAALLDLGDGLEQVRQLKEENRKLRDKLKAIQKVLSG